jgi:hypothetical protein
MSAPMPRWFLLLALACACNTPLCRDPQVDRRLQSDPARPKAAAAERAWKAPEYTAPHIATPPTIDGKLDDAAWQQAPWTPYFRRSSSDTPGTQRTRAKLAWDDGFLYVAFEVADQDILTRDPKTGLPYEHDDDTLYMSEVVEVFLDADANDATYNEIEVSPLNRLFDASFVGRRTGMDLGWSSGVQHAVQVDGTVNEGGDVDRGWTAELAIPFGPLSALPHRPPQAGERWKFNLYRLDHDSSGAEEGQAFSPVYVGDFHHLPKFGALILGGSAQK